MTEKATSEDQKTTYWLVDRRSRRQYEDVVASFSQKRLLDDFHCTYDEYVRQFVPLLVELSDRFGDPAQGLQDVVVRNWLCYATEGIPRFLMKLEGGKWRVRTTEELSHLESNLLFELDWMIAVTEHSRSLPLEEAVQTGGGFLVSFVALINMFVARMKLDAGEPLSVAELALLAQMKEASVRNAISRGEIESQPDSSIVVISAQDASQWLSGRRRFNRSQLPKSQDSVEALRLFCIEYFA